MQKTGDQLKKHIIRDWEWHVENPSILEPWFVDYEKYFAENCIKSNKLRKIFRIKSENNVYYVKHDTPAGHFGKLKSRFRSKTKAEFNAACLLDENSIPVVKYLGWGQRKNSGEGMLISREQPGTVSARAYWFSECQIDAAKKNSFIDSLTHFLNRVLSSGIHHPDFHLGNLLFLPEKSQFIMVDPYGISKPKNLTDDQSFSMYKIIGSLRGELSNAEAIDLIIKSGMTVTEEQAKDLWTNILHTEAKDMNNVRQKREQQILTGYQKYCKKLEIDENICWLRIRLSGEPFITPEDVKISNFSETKMELPRAEAQKIWLRSFNLQFHRIPHLQPILWFQQQDSQDDLQDDLLVWESNDESVNDENMTPDSDAYQEFIKRCKISGIDGEGLNIKNISLIHGRIVINDITKLDS